MKVKHLAKMFSSFRVKFSTIKDPAREKQLTSYYESLIKLHQVFPLFNENGILVALCETWLINESDIDKIRNGQAPSNIGEGNTLFISNVTIDPNFLNLGVYKFYRKLLYEVFKESKGTKIKKVFWNNINRKKLSRIFKV